MGLFLRSDYLDDEGSTAEIDLHMPGQPEPIRLAGEVVRVETTPMAAGMAIRFANLGAPVRRALANLVIERSCMATA
jgi:hypothetical protein